MAPGPQVGYACHKVTPVAIRVRSGWIQSFQAVPGNEKGENVTGKQVLNYELLAIKLGEAVKWHRSVNEVERIAQATIKLPRQPHPHPNITSARAQTVYDYVKTLEACSDIDEDEKRKRLAELIRELIPERDDKVRAELLKMIGAMKTIPMAPPDFVVLVQDQGLAEILEHRWLEVHRCIDAGAHLAAIVMMGSLLEGVLLAVVTMHPEHVSCAKTCPKDPKTGQPLNPLCSAAYEGATRVRHDDAA